MFAMLEGRQRALIPEGEREWRCERKVVKVVRAACSSGVRGGELELVELDSMLRFEARHGYGLRHMRHWPCMSLSGREGIIFCAIEGNLRNM